ncbi:MAG TPA: methyltransferase, partial [Chitinophagaceae bacterium]|nr:methyltransferase [Chitinophagaceae bacterium]
VKSQIPIAIGTKVKNLLDVGTGTGLLSLMIAQKNPEAKVLAIEIDEAAKSQAGENVEASLWKKRVDVRKGDVRNYSFPEKFDFIISNPPFYEKEIRSETDSKNVAHHSENLTVKELLSVIRNNLKRDGSFFLLLPYKRNEEIKTLFKDHEFHISKTLFIRQSVKHEYFRIFIKGDLKVKEKETEFDEMSVWDEEQQYTARFIHLLKDYYLHL